MQQQNTHRIVLRLPPPLEPYKSAGRWIGRGIDPFLDVGNVLVFGIQSEGDPSHEVVGFEFLLVSFPSVVFSRTTNLLHHQHSDGSRALYTSLPCHRCIGYRLF